MGTASEFELQTPLRLAFTSEPTAVSCSASIGGPFSTAIASTALGHVGIRVRNLTVELRYLAIYRSP
jgi:hypothetical protein